MGVLELDVTFNVFAVLQLHVIKLYYVLNQCSIDQEPVI